MYSIVSCDESGYPRGFSHHDGFLDGVLAVGSDVLLSIRSIDEESRVVALRDVRALHVQAFRQGNIVLSLRLVPPSVVASDPEIRRMLSERLFLDSSDMTGAATVFRLEASYGADIIAVCGAVEVSEARERLMVSGVPE